MSPLHSLAPTPSDSVIPGPGGTDNDYLVSIMKPSHDPGKFANWIAPPTRGIEGQPIDFEYVQLRD